MLNQDAKNQIEKLRDTCRGYLLLSNEEGDVYYNYALSCLEKAKQIYKREKTPTRIFHVN